MELDKETALLERELATAPVAGDNVPCDVVCLATPRPLDGRSKARAIRNQFVKALACMQALLEALHVQSAEASQAVDLVGTLAANEQAAVGGLVDRLGSVEQGLPAHLAPEALPLFVPDVLGPDGIVPKFGVQDVQLDGRPSLIRVESSGPATGIDVDVRDDYEVLASEGLCLRGGDGGIGFTHGSVSSVIL